MYNETMERTIEAIERIQNMLYLDAVIREKVEQLKGVRKIYTQLDIIENKLLDVLQAL